MSNDWFEGDGMINGQSWRFKINDHGLEVHYTSPCGDILQKLAPVSFLQELYGCRPDPTDLEQCELMAKGVIDEDSIVPSLLGSAATKH